MLAMIKYKKNIWLATAFTWFHGLKQRRVDKEEREELRRKEGKGTRKEERRIFKKGREITTTKKPDTWECKFYLL